MEFKGNHVLSVNQFNRDSIQKVFDVADLMTPYAMRQKRTTVLDGAILGNLFFEPSTRTRVSFGTAFNLLGGEVRHRLSAKDFPFARTEGDKPLST